MAEHTQIAPRENRRRVKVPVCETMTHAPQINFGPISLAADYTDILLNLCNLWVKNLAKKALPIAWQRPLES
jgi:hypothetical protein